MQPRSNLHFIFQCLSQEIPECSQSIGLMRQDARDGQNLPFYQRHNVEMLMLSAKEKR